MSKYSRNVLYLGIASSIAFGAGMGPAAASLIQSLPTQNFSDTHSVTDNLTTAGATSSTFNYGSAKNFSQFDTSIGVLTGAMLNLSNSIRTKSGSLSASGSSGSGSRTANGLNANTAANISAPGAASIALGTYTGPSLTCTTNSPASCSASSAPVSGAPVSANNAVPSGSLSLYAGAGTVSLQPSADISAEAKTSGARPFTSVTDTYTLGWSGTLGINYEYVYHAIPSFNALDPLNPQSALLIDFGTVIQNSGGGQLLDGFSIYNLISHSDAANTSKLKISAINGSGSSGTLSSDIFQLSGLAAGMSSFFDVFFDTTVLGGFQTVYDFTLNDDVNGVGVNDYTLHLTLQGMVAPPQNVPEPGTITLLGSALLAAGGLTRRRRRTEVLA